MRIACKIPLILLILVLAASSPAIGPAQSENTAVGSGYWYGIRPISHGIYLPVVMKNYAP